MADFSCTLFDTRSFNNFSPYFQLHKPFSNFPPILPLYISQTNYNRKIPRRKSLSIHLNVVPDRLSSMASASDFGLVSTTVCSDGSVVYRFGDESEIAETSAIEEPDFVKLDMVSEIQEKSEVVGVLDEDLERNVTNIVDQDTDPQREFGVKLLQVLQGEELPLSSVTDDIYSKEISNHSILNNYDDHLEVVEDNNASIVQSVVEAPENDDDDHDESIQEIFGFKSHLSSITDDGIQLLPLVESVEEGEPVEEESLVDYLAKDNLVEEESPVDSLDEVKPVEEEFSVVYLERVDQVEEESVVKSSERVDPGEEECLVQSLEKDDSAKEESPVESLKYDPVEEPRVDSLDKVDHVEEESSFGSLERVDPVEEVSLILSLEEDVCVEEESTVESLEKDEPVEVTPESAQKIVSLNGSTSSLIELEERTKDEEQIINLPQEPRNDEIIDLQLSESVACRTDEIRFPKFVLCSGAFLSPHPSKALTGGEDAYFIANQNWLGVADGVGQWSLDGTNPGVYARELMDICKTLILEKNNDVELANPVLGMLDECVVRAKSPGSATVIISHLGGQILHAANVGDAGFIVIRNGGVYKKSSRMFHEFNFPIQIQRGEDASQIVEEYRIDLDEGDVIVTATDGLFDNLYEKEITLIVTNSLQDEISPQKVAEVLGTRAQEVGGSAHARSPFADAAHAAGYVGYTGGKPDDVAVIVSFVRVPT